MKRMTRQRPMWLLTVALLLGACVAPASAQQAAAIEHRSVAATAAESQTSARDRAIADARAWAEQLREERGMVGLSIAVGIAGEIIWADAVGHANLELDVPATAQTKFRIGSVSKPVTAAAAALLVEQGALDLDASVHEMIPEFPPHPESEIIVTPRMLAGHLSGIRHYRGGDAIGSQHFTSVRRGLQVFLDDPYDHLPGERYHYSSYAWNLFSAVIEHAAEQPFLDVMQELVFEPLQMHDTCADNFRTIVPHRASFYHRNRDGSLRNADFHDNSYKWAGGGFIATPSDLVRFGFAHCQPGYLQADTLDMLFTAMRDAEGNSTNYGLGWSIGRDNNGRRIVSHSGSSTGGAAYLLVYPEQEIVIALLTNTRLTSTRPFAMREARELIAMFEEALVPAEGAEAGQ